MNMCVRLHIHPNLHTYSQCVCMHAVCVFVRVCVHACVCVCAGDSECKGVVFQYVSVSLCFV